MSRALLLPKKTSLVAVGGEERKDDVLFALTFFCCSLWFLGGPEQTIWKQSGYRVRGLLCWPSDISCVCSSELVSYSLSRWAMYPFDDGSERLVHLWTNKGFHSIVISENKRSKICS